MVFLLSSYGQATTGMAESPSTHSVSLTSVLAASAEIVETTDTYLTVEAHLSDAPWAREVIARSTAARSALASETADNLLVHVRVVVAPDRDIFLKLVGDWAINAAAVAIPPQQIVINLDAMRQTPESDFQKTLMHEFMHLHLALRVPRPIPLWLNEGLAQIVARQWTVDDEANLALAKLTGSLIPLREIQSRFPADASRQRLAYQQSYAVTSYLLQSRGHSVASFVRELATPTTTPPLDFLSPTQRDTLEEQWRQTLSWRVLASAMLNSTLFWIITAGLLVMAYFLTRLRRRRVRAAWSEDIDVRIAEAQDEYEGREIDHAHPPYESTDDSLDSEYKDPDSDDENWPRRVSHRPPPR